MVFDSCLEFCRQGLWKCEGSRSCKVKKIYYNHSFIISIISSSFSCIRSESSSLASSGRRKRNRVVSTITPVERKIMGRCGDLIIQKVSTEYGCSEAGKLFDGDNGSKLLKDMFYSLLITQQLSLGNNF